MLGYLLPVFRKAGDADIGEWMTYHLHQHTVRYGSNVSPCLGRLDCVKGMTEAGGNHLSGEFIIVIDLHRIGNDTHPMMADIIEPPYT